MTDDGMTGTSSLEEFVGALAAPRHVWMMVPAAFVGETVDKLAPLLERGDTIIDGGNSWYRDDIDRAGPLARDRGIDYVDVGVSGGVHGLERGYCLMVGGPATGGRAAHADLRLPRPRRRRRRTDAHPRRRRRHAVERRARLAALRPQRCRPLRQDGPQRHRVRADGGLRRGAQRPRQGEHRRRGPRRGRRDGAAAASPVLPLRLRPRRHHRGVAPRQRRLQLAARPDRRGARRRPQARRFRRERLGLR